MKTTKWMLVGALLDLFCPILFLTMKVKQSEKLFSI
ncbi:hypothetical protein T479_23615 [Lysinibacillus varians]|nr:hypothetical protein T479_23615 [Lysinibacillus varians]